MDSAHSDQQSALVKNGLVGSPGAVGLSVLSDWDGSGQKVIGPRAAAIPMQRIGAAEECTGAFLTLASEQLASYVTGQVIEVNGGSVMP